MGDKPGLQGLQQAQSLWVLNLSVSGAGLLRDHCSGMVLGEGNQLSYLELRRRGTVKLLGQC